MRMSSLMSLALAPLILLDGFMASISRLSRRFSSLYVCNCRFHSSTFAVDSCNALVKRLLLLFNVVNSISHFFAFAQLRKRNGKRFRTEWGKKFKWWYNQWYMLNLYLRYGTTKSTAVAKIEVIQGLAVAAVAYLWASASFSLSFSYFNCCSLCGCDSVDELFIDRLCFIISILFAFVLFFICDGLSGIGGCTTCCCKWIAKKSIRNAIVYKFFHKVTEEQ